MNFDHNFLLHCANEDELIDRASELALILRMGDVLVLRGDPGAGKTTFVRHFIHALPGGDKIKVNSPTFNLINIYEVSGFVINHCDLYRIKSVAEVTEIGLFDILYDKINLTIIEWPDIISDNIPGDALCIQFAVSDTSHESRLLTYHYNDCYINRLPFNNHSL